MERDGEEQLVGENQSTYIPMGCHLRLSNPGRIAVEMIEVEAANISAKTTSCASTTSTGAVIRRRSVLITPP